MIADPCNFSNVSQKISLRVNQCYQIKREEEKKIKNKIINKRETLYKRY